MDAVNEAWAAAFWSQCYGIVDPTDAMRLGGYPGAFRDALGIRTEEFCPLFTGWPANGTVTVAAGGVAVVCEG